MQSKEKLKVLHQKLDEILEEQKKDWKHLIYAKGKYYQSLKEINIHGQRDTEQRFKDYEIEKFLNKDQITLDIGANTGFFSINLAKYIKSCECVEINPSLTKIGQEVTKFLNRNVTFHTKDFGTFKTDRKYDIIMSLAADEVADRLNTLKFEQYIDKILSMMEQNGLIFFESQAEDIMLNKFGPKLDYLKEKFEIILQKEIGSTYPFNVPKRIFIIGRKKEREMKQKVFLFGIDGAMPEKIFDEWLDELPTIKKLMQQGCYAKLNSCIPPISITAWTSMTTGKKPADHGIFEVIYKNKLTNNLKLVSANNVNEKRIWETIAENGKKAISCFVPLTYPPKEYNGILISGPPNPPEEKIEFTHPKELKQELNKILDKKLLLDIKNFRDFSKKEILYELYKLTKMHIKIIKHLLMNKEWNLFFTVIKASDRMNHCFWKYCDKLHREYKKDSEFENTLKNYYKFLDKELGEIISLLDEKTKIIVLSDHGITRMHTRINFSDWLIKEGYLVLKDKIKNITNLQPEMIDWNKTKVFALGAYDCQIYINLKGRKTNGIVEINDYHPLLNELQEKIKKIKGDQGEELRTKIFKKQDFFMGKYWDTAPDMIIYFDNLHYGTNTTKIGNQTLYSKQTALGSDNAAHSMQGIFITNKSKYRGAIHDVDIIDIFPTILNEFKIKIPEDLKGKIIE